MTEPTNDWDDYPAPLIPYVPTTQVVRDAYVRGMRNAFIASASEHEAEFDRWLKAERFTAWQQGYAARVEDDSYGIGADPDEWVDNPKPVERPQEDTDG